MPATAPSVMFEFVLINQATDRPDLTKFLPTLVAGLTQGVAIFTKFRGATASFRAASSSSDRKPGEIACNIRHNQPGDPQGALAWHQVTNGVPDVELPLDDMSGLTGDSEALDVCLSHEVFETMGDPGANGLVDNGNGKVSAEEECDRVEDTFFKVPAGINISNFLIAAAWIPGAPGPYDYLCALESQLDANNNVTMTPGGYDIEATAPTDEADVTPQGAQAAARARSEFRARALKPIEGKRLKRKSNRYSRASRRGVKFAS
jgi:hypothetical protein